MFNKFDVLLAQHEPTQRIHFASNNHIGNRRFQVFLEIYRQPYTNAERRALQASSENEKHAYENECNGIVRTIVDTICHKCIPKGRFFEANNVTPSKWDDLGDGPVARERVRQGLKGQILMESSVETMNFEVVKPVFMEQQEQRRRKTVRFSDQIEFDSGQERVIPTPTKRENKPVESQSLPSQRPLKKRKQKHLLSTTLTTFPKSTSSNCCREKLSDNFISSQTHENY